MTKCLFKPEVEERDGSVILTLHIKIKRFDNRRVLVAPDGRDLFLSYTSTGDAIPQQHLVRAVGQAFAWHREVTHNGSTIDSVAKAVGITPSRVGRLIQLTRLSPTIIRAVLTGQLGSSVGLCDLQAAAVHLDWSLQAAALMLDRPQAKRA